MKNIIQKYFWTFLVILSALGLAICAAYFSISGLSKLFAGSSKQIIIMASFLEFSKIATTAVLHRFWNYIKWSLKIPLTIMVIVIMIITSSGIYGFLAEAYTSTSNEMKKIESQIELIEKQKDQKNKQILSIDNIIENKRSRVNSLVGIRVQQESRIDALYDKRMTSSARQAQALIDKSNDEISLNQKEIDSLTNVIQSINSEIGDLDIEILDLQNTDIAAELGPLKYISNITGNSMESVINWFIMAIMIAFDPLAILLVVLANNVYDNSNKKGAKKIEKQNSLPEEKLLNNDFETDNFDDSEIDVSENIKLKEDDSKDIVYNENIENSLVDYGFSYDFIPEKEREEVFEYVEGNNGEFKKVEEKVIPQILKGIGSNPLYMELLNIFYLNGNRKIGDIIPPYETFLKNLSENNIICEEKIVKNFLTVANLLGIVNMSDKNNVKLLKDYDSAKQIFSLVSN